MTFQRAGVYGAVIIQIGASILVLEAVMVLRLADEVRGYR